MTSKPFAARHAPPGLCPQPPPAALWRRGARGPVRDGILAALSALSLGWIIMMGVPILGVAGILMLRRATQALDVAPTALLDEREVSQRDRGYRDAFHISAALVFALWVLTTIDAAVAKAGTSALLGVDAWIYLTLATFFTVLTLPAAALTWRWQPPTDDHDE